MSYIVPFQNIALFESTFKHQINKATGKIEDRGFVFNRHFGDKEGELPVEDNRYRLIWMPGCPHSNKAVITARLLGLDKYISIGECGVLRDPRGWVFSEDIGEVDPVLKIHYLDDAYLKGDPDFIGRSTVPAIADITTGAIVQNEAWDIPRYLVTDWKKFHKENAPDLYPEDLRAEIDEQITFIKEKVNAYACGFARDQEQYDKGYEMFHSALDVLEDKLSKSRFLHGDYITLSDIHLYVALIRFHINYHLVFGVNKKRLVEYPALWGYTRELFQADGFYEYTKTEWIKKHYQLSPHMRAKLGNVKGLVGTGPDERELYTDPGRKGLSKDPGNLYRVAKNESIDAGLYAHNDVNTELRYLEEYVVKPIKKAGEATFQTDLQRWSDVLRDSLIQIDSRLAAKRFLLGETPTQADHCLYKELLRLDHITYHQDRLNAFKSRDFSNIARYERDLSELPELKDFDIVREKEEAYRNLDADRNPYGLIFRGPEKG